MKIFQKMVVTTLSVSIFACVGSFCFAQDSGIIFGKAVSLEKAISKIKEKDKQLSWVNVNTAPDTWHKEKDILVCSGHPIGVMRSEKQYENFILHIEWKHIEPGGNSGVFVWSNANPPVETRLPDGVEVQMLSLIHI